MHLFVLQKKKDSASVILLFSVFEGREVKMWGENVMHINPLFSLWKYLIFTQSSENSPVVIVLVVLNTFSWVEMSCFTIDSFVSI